MLVTKIEEIQKHYPSNTIRDFGKLASFMNTAQRIYLLPVLGTPLMEYLESYYGQPSGDKYADELLELTQYPIVQFGMYQAFPALNVVINESGGITAATSQNSSIASKDRTDKLSESTLTQAWDAIDYLLQWLESNSKHFSGEDGKELWPKSGWYTLQTGHLVFTAAEFQESGIFINNSRRRFIELLPAMKRMERTYIRSALSNPFIDALINRKLSGSLTEADKEVLPLLQTALVLYTAAADKKPDGPDGKNGFAAHDYVMEAAENIGKAINLIKADPESFPDFPGNAPETKKVSYFQNDDSNSIFVMPSYGAHSK